MNQAMNRKKIKLVVLNFILGFVFSNLSLATDKIIAHPNSEELLDELNIATQTLNGQETGVA